MSNVVLKCSICNAAFSGIYGTAKSAREVHQRTCQPTVDVKYKNLTIHLQRNASTREFMCYCDASGCPRGYKTTRGIKDHAKSLQSNWIGSEVCVCFFFPEPFNITLLQNLILHQRYHLKATQWYEIIKLQLANPLLKWLFVFFRQMQ